MNMPAIADAYGVQTEPATLRIQRLLPGPVERVWDYLTQSELRRQWLAAGEMQLNVGAPFELVWRNDELTNPPGRRPDGFSDEHRMQSRILELDAPRKLAFAWNDSGEVSFELEPRGDKVMLTVTNRRLSGRTGMLMVGAGWHMHLDLLVARVTGAPSTEPFWDGWSRLKQEYDRRLAA